MRLGSFFRRVASYAVRTLVGDPQPATQSTPQNAPPTDVDTDRFHRQNQQQASAQVTGADVVTTTQTTTQAATQTTAQSTTAATAQTAPSAPAANVLQAQVQERQAPANANTGRSSSRTSRSSSRSRTQRSNWRGPRVDLPTHTDPTRVLDWTPLQKADRVRPADKFGQLPVTERLQVGLPVKATIDGQLVEGRVGGWDYKGRCVLRQDDGTRRIVQDWADLQVPSFANDGASALDKVDAENVVKAPDQLVRVSEAALDMEVCGTHTAREYVDAFHKAGYEVFIVGGAVRDAIGLMAQKGGTDDAAILDKMNDIDIVTTAPPNVAREICEQVAPELSKGGVWSPPFVEQFGVVLAGGPKAGLPNPEGIDICSMKSRGMNTEQEMNADTGEKSFPTDFAHDLRADAHARDFCCNALYYDPINKAVVDPTGNGIADAERQVLTVPSLDKLTDPTLSARFWKFRKRGYGTSYRALKLIRRSAEHLFRTSTGKDRWQLTSTLGRCAPKDCKTEQDVLDWLQELRASMRDDGCEDLFDKAIRGGVQKGVVREVLKRTNPDALATLDGGNGRGGRR